MIAVCPRSKPLTAARLFLRAALRIALRRADGRFLPPPAVRGQRDRMDRSRRQNRTPIGRPQAVGAGPSDLYDYLRPVEPSGKRRRVQKRITITDDWPEVVPITQAEVRIVEAYLGDVLDKLFGPLP